MRDTLLVLGQFYTPASVADLIVSFCVDQTSQAILDPGCGTGTFLLSSYRLLRDATGKNHSALLDRLWGMDISPFACELAVINLFRQDLASFDNFPRVIPGSFFGRRNGETVSFPLPRQGVQERVEMSVPKFDAIVGNPPYLRSQNQDDLDPGYRKQLFSSAARQGINAHQKTDLLGFFVYHALEFCKPGGRLGFVVSASWLNAKYVTVA